MEKRRDSRQEQRLSNVSAVGEGPYDHDRHSFAISITDLQGPRSFSPVSPISPSQSPGPSDQRRKSLNRSTSLPTSSSSENRHSMAKPPGIGLAISGQPTHTASSSTTDLFDPNTSRFISRPGSAASSTFDPSVPYRSRISRVSFSYPRRPTTPQLQQTHPYALYQQTTFEEPEEIEAQPTPQQIPVGFSERNVPFERRTGPDGEELAVLSAGGHMEQLPPYSRYPEAGPMPTKGASVASHSGPLYNPAGVGSSSHNQGPLPPHVITDSPVIASPMIPSSHPSPYTPHDFTPIMQTQSFPSQHTPNLPPHSSPPPQTHTQTSLSNDSRGVQSSASSLAEDKKRESTGWRSIKKKRVLCGIVPLWVAILVCVLALFLAIIAGGVLGGLLSSHKDRNRK
jgi:hypothetical protein